MGHYYCHQDDAFMGDLFSEEESSDEEEVWDPLMDFQEGEAEREINILVEPKIEQDEDGLTLTVSGTFERFHPMIYIAPFNGHRLWNGLNKEAAWLQSQPL